MIAFGQLNVWHQAHLGVVHVYAATANPPSEERRSLTSHVRRARVSMLTVPAEGCGRVWDAGLARCLQTPTGSASELEYRPLGLQVIEVKRLPVSFVKRLGAGRKQLTE